MGNPPVVSYLTACQDEILSQQVAPVHNVPYVEQGFFLQLYNYSSTAVSLSVYFVSNPPIADSTPEAVLKFGANLIKNNGAPEQIELYGQSNARYFPQQTLQSRDCFIFGIQYYLQPKKSVSKLGNTPTESASSRGMVQIAFFQPGLGPSIKSLATIRQVFTSYDANGAPTDVSSSAYPVPAFDAYPLLDMETPLTA